MRDRRISGQKIFVIYDQNTSKYVSIKKAGGFVGLIKNISTFG